MTDNPLITAKQAREITGGRAPLVPLIYEEALKALDACVAIDDAKYWSDKADALAAWAKIYRSDDAATKAKRLKLHAYRRMGELAAAIRPPYIAAHRTDGHNGTNPGPVSLLVEHGLIRSAADAARKLAKLPKKQFDDYVAGPRPPSPYTIAAKLVHGSEAWSTFSTSAGAAMHFRSFCRAHGAKELARGMSTDEAAKAREIAVEIQEWLDDFERHLTKERT